MGLIRVTGWTTHSAAYWTSVNPYLKRMELGLETEEPHKAKLNISDIPKRWNDLPYWKPGGEGGGGGSTDWGDIGGTLSDQTDLQAALDGKLDGFDEQTPLAEITAETKFIGKEGSEEGTVTVQDVNFLKLVTTEYDFATGGEQNLLPAVPADTLRIIVSVAGRATDSLGGLDNGMTFGWNASNLGSFDVDATQQFSNGIVTAALSHPANVSGNNVEFIIGAVGDILKANYSGATTAATAKFDVIYYDVPA